MINAIQTKIQLMGSGKMRSRDLGVIRILYCAVIFAVTWTRFADWGFFLNYGGLQSQRFLCLDCTVFGASAWYWLQWVWFISIGFSCIGFWTRTSLSVAIISLWALISPLSPTPYDTANIFYCLLALLLAPGVQSIGLDSLGQQQPLYVSSWPRQFVVISIGVAYLAQAVNKLYFMGGVEWLHGTTLQVWLRRYYHFFGEPIMDYVSSRSWLCQGLSVFTLVFEVFFISIIFWPRLKWIFVPVALLFHAGVYSLMKVVFIFLFCPAFLFLIDLDWIVNKFKKYIS